MSGLSDVQAMEIAEKIYVTPRDLVKMREQIAPRDVDLMRHEDPDEDAGPPPRNLWAEGERRAQLSKAYGASYMDEQGRAYYVTEAKK